MIFVTVGAYFADLSCFLSGDFDILIYLQDYNEIICYNTLASYIWRKRERGQEERGREGGRERAYAHITHALVRLLV